MDLSTSSRTADEETLLLNDTVDGVVDHKGHPVLRFTSGGWRSAGFIIGVEVAERFAYYGIESNLISYLTGPLGQSTASAAANVNAWAGVSSLLPLFGAFVADSFLGRYRTIIVANLLYIMGLGLLSLSAILPTAGASGCQTNRTLPCLPSQIQLIVFFFSLYLVAIAQSGHKPCVQAFGADQFDGQDPQECKARSSFFNWWYFGICGGSLGTVLIVSYVQENISWALGFGIPCIAMVLGLFVFLLGTKTYRYTVMRDEKNPFLRIGRVLIAAFSNRGTSPSLEATKEGNLPHQSHEQFKFLNKALLSPDGLNQDGRVFGVVDVEEAKAVLRLVPIWGTCLVYGIVFAQVPTFFTKQGATMQRTIWPGFDIPPASLQSVVSLAIFFVIPIYDRGIVPVARAFTGRPSGITMLQRIGTGMFLSALSVVIAALVEIKRLKTAKDYDLVDSPGVTIPMSVWWLVPQYLLQGVSDVFTMVGLQEFFYDQVPTDLRSVGLALYLSIFGVGSFLSSFLISIIEETTGGNGRDSWFSNNLNRAHLDFYYGLLAGLSAVAFALYLYFARFYIYNRARFV
ncbi:protein NRT1/ PTR FAMILY 5.10-like [Humulus lupulus]|uniref:protein NRT1/ PTR FAMILY 5.10-like n=1 Tax=Humulus lupulus TaxID=3486 RepID=UPI002B417C59|nr:protein NRT1/ PTR FAMILY 5.10-like [Humulus lupulus]